MKKLAVVVLVVVLGSAVSVVGRGGALDPQGHDAMNPPVARVAGGQLRGYVSEGTFAFVGIRYATAGRFEMPRPVEPWEGVRSAQTYGPVCPVPAQTEVSADEFYWPHTTG